MADTRGSWNLIEALMTQWQARGLDAEFRAYWEDPTDTSRLAIHDMEARPDTPPDAYCLFMVENPVPVQRESGDGGDTYRREEMYRVTFQVFAKSSQSLGKSGKRIARDLITLVAAAFDPQNILDMTPDCHIKTERAGDFSRREDDQEWSWTLAYELHLDVAYSV